MTTKINYSIHIEILNCWEKLFVTTAYADQKALKAGTVVRRAVSDVASIRLLSASPHSSRSEDWQTIVVCIVFC